jgi:DNA mismatch repair protein MutL
LATVREALGKFNIAPSLDFTLETQIDMPAMPQQPTTIAMPRLQVDPNYNPFKLTSYPRNTSAGWEQLYPAAPVEQHAIQVEQPLFVLPEVNEQTPLIQWQNKYILLPAESGLMMVHQHRVHVAILYQELLKQFDMQQGASQSLLFPEVLELSYEDVLTMQSLMDDLQAIGFSMDQLSPTAFTITAVPSQLGAVNPCETLLQVVHQVQDTGSNATQQWRETMAIALADRMAIPMGKSLSDAEMRDLLMRFYENQASQYLTNGQTIFTIITPDEVQKRF